METKFTPGLVAKRLMVCLFLACSSSCQQIGYNHSEQREAETEPEIYYLVRAKNEIGVWMSLMRDNGGSVPLSPVYLSPVWYPPSALPPLEQAILSRCTGDQESCNLPDAKVEHILDNLTLSPDHKFLAWRDSLVYCPNANCVGMSQILLWDTERKEVRTLLVVPRHISPLISQNISDIAWSSNGVFIAYLHSSHELGWSRLRAIDIRSESTLHIDDNIYKFEWAPRSTRIAYIGWEYVDTERYAFLRIAKPGNQNATVSFNNDWDDIRSTSWSSDEKRVAVVARTKALNGWGLFIANLENKTITKITNLVDAQPQIARWSPLEPRIAVVSNLGKVVSILDVDSNMSTDIPAPATYIFGENISWSPNGQLIAVNTYPTQDQMISNGIAFINTKTGSIMDWLNVDGISENWIWSTSGDDIIFNLENKNTGCLNSPAHGIGLYDWQTGVIEPVVFHPHITDAIANCEMIIGEIAP